MNSHEPATTESTDCAGNENPAQSVNEFLPNAPDPMQSFDEFIEDEPNPFQSFDEFTDDEVDPMEPIGEFAEDDPGPKQPIQNGNPGPVRNRNPGHNSTAPPSGSGGTLSSFPEGAKNLRSGVEQVGMAADAISKVVCRHQRRKDKLRRRRWEDNMILVDGFVRSGLGHKCVDLLRYAVDKFTDR